MAPVLPAWRSPRLSAAGCSCTSRRHNAQRTEVRSVHYPWHAWHGRSLVIRESLVRGGQAVHRCILESDDDAAKSVEIPQWMFDRATCCGTRQAERPIVDSAALLQLKALVSVALVAGERVLEAQHRSSNGKGDADAKARSSRSQSSTGSVSSPSKGAALAQLTSGGERTNDAVARPDAADESSGTIRHRPDREDRGR